MPAYFSLDIFFDPEIDDNFVRSIHKILLDDKFSFLSSDREGDKLSLSEIEEYNNRKLLDKFKLGFTQHFSEDYKQIILDNDDFSQVRCFWMYMDEHIMFSIIIPEDEVTIYNRNGYEYQKDKILIIHDLAQKFLTHDNTLLIQTSLEGDGPTSLNLLKKNGRLAYNPFSYVRIQDLKYVKNINKEHIRGIVKGFVRISQ